MELLTKFPKIRINSQMILLYCTIGVSTETFVNVRACPRRLLSPIIQATECFSYQDVKKRIAPCHISVIQTNFHVLNDSKSLHPQLRGLFRIVRPQTRQNQDLLTWSSASLNSVVYPDLYPHGERQMLVATTFPYTRMFRLTFKASTKVLYHNYASDLSGRDHENIFAPICSFVELVN